MPLTGPPYSDLLKSKSLETFKRIGEDFQTPKLSDKSNFKRLQLLHSAAGDVFALVKVIIISFASALT